MSSDSSYCESNVSVNESEASYRSEYEREAEPDSEGEISLADDEIWSYSSDEAAAACMDDPEADEEWTARYEEQMRELEEKESILKDRLDGVVELNDWCKCGNCSIEALQNFSKCYCCSELEGCCKSMQSDLVFQDLPEDTQLCCITEHPGFHQVCLQKWSLRIVSWTFKTKGKQRYKQTGSEERFLRSVSYRAFSRLVYGILADKRVALPSCAYTAIRKQFPISKEETYTGFDLDEVPISEKETYTGFDLDEEFELADQ